MPNPVPLTPGIPRVLPHDEIDVVLIDADDELVMLRSNVFAAEIQDAANVYSLIEQLHDIHEQMMERRAEWVDTEPDRVRGDA